MGSVALTDVRIYVLCCVTETSYFPVVLLCKDDCIDRRLVSVTHGKTYVQGLCSSSTVLRSSNKVACTVPRKEVIGLRSIAPRSVLRSSLLLTLRTLTYKCPDSTLLDYLLSYLAGDEITVLFVGDGTYQNYCNDTPHTIYFLHLI
uniref:SFRICE_013983 n=1 Tax=Spodoptera frugiperda TaxID=7108 RepID=A0A2H1WYS2_SPOFR